MWSPDIFSPKVFQGKLYFGEEHDTVVIACFLFKQVDKNPYHLHCLFVITT